MGDVGAVLRSGADQPHPGPEPMIVVMSEHTQRRRLVPPLAAEDHVCAACELSYLQVSVEAAVGRIHHLPAVVRDVLAPVPVTDLRVRPAREAWSITEYVCHLRDVHVSYTVRLYRARTEDRPVLEPMLNDLRAVRFRYNERDLAGVLEDLAAAVGGFCEEVSRVREGQWDRVVTRLPGEQRTALWLVRQIVHEGVHHVDDIRRTGVTVAVARARGRRPAR